jgi:hypothetical protein
MTNRRFMAIMFGLLAIAAAVIFIGPQPRVQAQDTSGGDTFDVLVEITGPFHVVDGQVTIGEVIVAPAGAFQPALLYEGEIVTVTGYLLNDDTLQAVSLVVEEDLDGDGLVDKQDNCPEVANEDQLDTDEDDIGDACDPDQMDTDGDEVVNSKDNCPEVANPNQEDTDEDFVGDLCDPDQMDTDGDLVVDAEDNCPLLANADQADTDGDGVGDVCEAEPAVEEEEPAEELCMRDDHPVALALANEFAYQYDDDADHAYSVIADWHCSGKGFGEIARALLIAEKFEGEEGETVTADELLAMREAGQGWGQIKKEYGVKPSDLAPGRVISGKHQVQEEEQVQTQTETQTQAEVQTGKGNKGNNGTPPGQSKDKNKGKGKK